MSTHQMGPVTLKASLFPVQAHIFSSLIFHYDFCLSCQSIVDLQSCVLPTSFMYVFWGEETCHAACSMRDPSSPTRD